MPTSGIRGVSIRQRYQLHLGELATRRNADPFGGSLKGIDPMAWRLAIDGLSCIAEV